jgi:hypothetical protein
VRYSTAEDPKVVGELEWRLGTREGTGGKVDDPPIEYVETTQDDEAVDLNISW